MRNYPRELQLFCKIKPNKFDKGKRHFWGYQKGDYGLYSSEDQSYIRSMNEVLKQRRHTRSRTTDFPYEENINNSYRVEERNPEQDISRDLNSLKKEEVKLPSIMRFSAQTQTKPIMNVEVPVSDYQSKTHVKTEPVQVYQDEYETKNNQIKFSPSVRFSPTYVCSLQNPMPSYVIKPQTYRSRTYVRVQNQRSAKSGVAIRPY